MDKIKSFFGNISSKSLGYFALGLSVVGAGINYLITVKTNEEIISASAQKAAEIVLSTTENKETA